MKLKHVIDLTKEVDMLYRKHEQINELMDLYEEKKEAIEEHADDMCREMTEKEQERWDKLDEAIYDLQAEYDEVQNALDYIAEFCLTEV